MTYKYTPGDIVYIRPDIEVNKVYYMDTKDTEVTTAHDTFTDSMLKYKDTPLVISYYHSDRYRIEGSSYNFTDGMLVTSLSTIDLPKGAIQLPYGYYTPMEIPRKNKPPRKICAPSPELLEYQRSQLPYLNNLFLAYEHRHKAKDILHGFIKDRNCVTAASKHIGYDVTIMMDIVAFFDNVTTAHTGIPHPSLYTVDGYCGQGFATSPILSNIGILPIIARIKEFLDSEYTDRYAFTMYADDIQISINTDNFIEETADIIEIVTAAFESQGFEMHRHKTRVRRAEFGYRRILGINVGSDHIRATRKTMRKLRAAQHQSNGPSIGGLTTWSKCLLPRKLRQ